jgi:hypothetical protein
MPSRGGSEGAHKFKPPLFGKDAVGNQQGGKVTTVSDSENPKVTPFEHDIPEKIGQKGIVT